MTRRRSKASSEAGRGSSPERDGRAMIAWANAGREAAADAPRAPGSVGTSRQPRRRQARLVQRSARRATGHGPPPSVNEAGSRRGRRVRRGQSPCRSHAGAISPRIGPVEREGHPGAVTRLAVGPERAAMRERREAGERERQDPIARPPAGVRDEPDAARIVLEARVVEGSGDVGRSVSSVGWPMSGLRRWDGPATAERSRRVTGRGTRCREGLHLVGGLTVDGEVEAHRLGLGLDPDAEQDIDHLDDDHGADGRVGDRRRRPRWPG